MMKKTITLSLAFFLAGMTFAQDSTATKNWKVKTLFGVNGSQTSFVNWNSGGRNNISVLGFFSGTANWSKNKYKWDNSLDLALGGVRYIDSTGNRDGLQKSDDKIDLSTNFGYEFKDKWFFSAVGGFRSQFIDGFSYPNDSIRTSTFLAPGYASFALGIEYKPNDNLSLFLSPLATKMTFVNDQRLADLGAFGVEEATFSETNEVDAQGKRFRAEYGAYMKLEYNKELLKNVNFRTKLEMFSNYLNNPQNIDVNWDMLWTFKVNEWLSASLNWTLIYDDDIDIRDANGNVGPRTQFKSVLGLNLSMGWQNFKE